MSKVDVAETAILEQVTTARPRAARVNLLPPEIEQGRRLRRLQTGLGAGVVAVAVLMGGLYALEVNSAHKAEDDLVVAQAQTARLQAEQAQYADVPSTIAAIDAAEIARASAMVNDVEWFRTLNTFSLTLPTNVWFTSVSLHLGATGGAPAVAPPATPTPGGTAVTPTPGATAPGTTAPNTTAAFGQVTVNGAALDHPDVATWLDVLGRQPGMTDAYFTSSTRSKVGQKSIVTFTSTATVTDAALSHRYDRKQGS